MSKDPQLKPEPTTEALIAEGVRLKATIKAQEARLKTIAAKLTSVLPAGSHPGDDDARISIVEPTGKIKLTAESFAAVKAIAGTRFAKLFKAARAWAPVKGFREVLAAVLEKREQKQVLALVETEAGKYVKWD